MHAWQPMLNWLTLLPSLAAVLLVQRRGKADHLRPVGSLRRRGLLESRSRCYHQVRHRLRFEHSPPRPVLDPLKSSDVHAC